MEAKGILPKFWRRQQDGSDVPEHAALTEATGTNVLTHAAEAPVVQQRELLSYEDIYHAAGLLSPRSGYGIHKVIEMLNSDRIRELSKDIKRASVLMAIEASGTSVDDLLQDATRRQHALDSYEAGQRRQLEEFEVRKAQESAQIQAEMDRVAAHYTERIQHNKDQVTGERETLRNWQMMKQHESQRISEVLELCAKQPAPEFASTALQGPAGSTNNTAPRPGHQAEAAAGGHK